MLAAEQQLGSVALQYALYLAASDTDITPMADVVWASLADNVQALFSSGGGGDSAGGSGGTPDRRHRRRRRASRALLQAAPGGGGAPGSGAVLFNLSSPAQLLAVLNGTLGLLANQSAAGTGGGNATLQVGWRGMWRVGSGGQPPAPVGAAGQGRMNRTPRVAAQAVEAAALALQARVHAPALLHAGMDA